MPLHVRMSSRDPDERNRSSSPLELFFDLTFVVAVSEAGSGLQRGLVGGRAKSVLLGYPLHPPGKPEQLRVAHLPKVRAPMLFVQGSRDPFGGPDELAPFLQGLPAGTRLFAVDGGDHSLTRPKSSGETLAATMARVAAEISVFA